MRLRILNSALFALLFPLALFAQAPKGYIIHGHIGGLKEGEKVIMLLSNGRGFGEFENFLVKTDSAIVSNGEFVISGYVPDGPRRYSVEFSKHPRQEINLLFIDNNEEITITSPDIAKIPHTFIQHYVKVDGSPTSYSSFCLTPAEEFYYQNIGRIKSHAKQLRDSIGFDGKLLTEVFSARDLANTVLYQTVFAGESGLDPEIAKSNLIIPTEFGGFQRSGHALFWKDVYENLGPQKKNGFYGEWLKEQVKLCLGQPFPEFTLPQADGKSLAISQLIPKGKITLVHFWSSHSSGRADYQEELKILFKKYHEKGLNIIGVSSDGHVDEWKAQLKTEQYPWYNVIDLEGKITQGRYWETAGKATTNVLLDSQGKIIAWDVHGVELLWNLWKVFGE